MGRNTVSRTKHCFLREGLEVALQEKPLPGQPRKYTPSEQAEVIALACNDPPEGRQRWTLQLLTKECRNVGKSGGGKPGNGSFDTKKTNVNPG